eukprot:TRINITY_DN11018_c0_g1_i1.p1 TRINITY_DN11018_c0_g1~~TRINITY_DN11018_c0_g1_i1.p1  ORF type:complete len:377 (+),score=62.64 TRINITY_DN11018_c0_g1_i1:92-1132(+)
MAEQTCARSPSSSSSSSSVGYVRSGSEPTSPTGCPSPPVKALRAPARPSVRPRRPGQSAEASVLAAGCVLPHAVLWATHSVGGLCPSWAPGEWACQFGAPATACVAAAFAAWWAASPCRGGPGLASFLGSCSLLAGMANATSYGTLRLHRPSLLLALVASAVSSGRLHSLIVRRNPRASLSWSSQTTVMHTIGEILATFAAGGFAELASVSSAYLLGIALVVGAIAAPWGVGTMWVSLFGTEIPSSCGREGVTRRAVWVLSAAVPLCLAALATCSSIYCLATLVSQRLCVVGPIAMLVEKGAEHVGVAGGKQRSMFWSEAPPQRQQPSPPAAPLRSHAPASPVRGM